MLRTLLSAHPPLPCWDRLEPERWCGFLYAHGQTRAETAIRKRSLSPLPRRLEALLRDDETCKTVCYDLIPILLMDP